MQYTILGRTGLRVSRTAFGALPIQRVSLEEAGALLRRAFAAGVNFFDTARAYSDSEEKMGAALGEVREQIVIATKSHAQTGTELTAHLETSLQHLRTDYVDILQLHNPDHVVGPGEENRLYEAMQAAREAGKIRYIGMSNHRLPVATAAVESGLYDTVQYPLSAISDEKDLQLVEACRQHNVGFIAMKALCGGLLIDAAPAFAFLRQFENVVPIWGVQRDWELEQILEMEEYPPALDSEMWACIASDRAELAGNFCRACGYCLPCPAEIPIPMAARMTLLMRRAPAKPFTEPAWQEQMARIEQCTQCGQCASRCPYGLDTPRLLREQLSGYREMVAGVS